MVKPLALLLAASLLALTHEQKYATPKETKAEMCRRGIFQEGGDTAGFIDCSMVRRRGWRDLARRAHTLSGGREPHPSCPTPAACSYSTCSSAPPTTPPTTRTLTRTAPSHTPRSVPPRAHLFIILHHPTNEAGPQHTPHLHAQTLRPHPRSTLSPPRTTCVRCTFEPPAPARPLPPRSIV